MHHVELVDLLLTSIYYSCVNSINGQARINGSIVCTHLSLLWVIIAHVYSASISIDVCVCIHYSYVAVKVSIEQE